jgi:hypothetical protein
MVATADLMMAISVMAGSSAYRASLTDPLIGCGTTAKPKPLGNERMKAPKSVFASLQAKLF